MQELAAGSREAQTNPLYAVEVEYVPAHEARLRGVPVGHEHGPEVPIGVLNHEVAYDPKYSREDEEGATED